MKRKYCWNGGFLTVVSSVFLLEKLFKTFIHEKFAGMLASVRYLRVEWLERMKKRKLTKSPCILPE